MYMGAVQFCTTCTKLHSGDGANMYMLAVQFCTTCTKLHSGDDADMYILAVQFCTTCTFLHSSNSADMYMLVVQYCFNHRLCIYVYPMKKYKHFGDRKLRYVHSQNHTFSKFNTLGVRCSNLYRS